jgi:hypothetical protein
VAGSNLLHLRDQLSQHLFLIDTSASVSVLPFKSSYPSSFLTAANGSSISSFGQRQIPLKFHGISFSHNFHLADVQMAILGANFLFDNAFSVDLRRRCLHHVPSGRLLRLQGYGSLQLNMMCAATNQFDDLLRHFPELTSAITAPTSYLHSFTHYIPTKGHPIASKV